MAEDPRSVKYIAKFITRIFMSDHLIDDINYHISYKVVSIESKWSK